MKQQLFIPHPHPKTPINHRLAYGYMYMQLSHLLLFLTTVASELQIQDPANEALTRWSSIGGSHDTFSYVELSIWGPNKVFVNLGLMM
jgi:hypothetical protein